MKWRLNSKEIIRCCGSCGRIFWIWDTNKEMDGGCPVCGFAHYGARFVYGDWSYLKVLFLVLFQYHYKGNDKRLGKLTKIHKCPDCQSAIAFTPGDMIDMDDGIMYEYES